LSDSTSFEITVPAASLCAFALDLAALLEPAGCGEVLAPDGAAVLRMLEALAARPTVDECLTLAFAQDQPLLEFQAENPELTSAQAGCVAVGCFWVACNQGEGQYTVSFTSAGRSIAALMRESQSVQGAFRALAKHAATGNVYVINEWQDVTVL
jgi:hypothetical protein